MFYRLLLTVTLTLGSLHYNGMVTKASRSQKIDLPDSKCLSSDSARYYVPQYVQHKNGNAPLTILTSDRSSHQIVSHLTHILLTEALGYQDVRIAFQANEKRGGKADPLNDNITQVADLLGGTSESEIPQYMVDLEVWLPPGLSLDNLETPRKVATAGPLGPVVQYGWFLRNATVNAFWTINKTVDHWRYLTDPSVVKHFRPSKSDNKGLLLMQDDIGPKQVLLNTTNELIERGSLLIRPLSLPSKLTTSQEIESQLKKLKKLSTSQLLATDKSVLILTWYPNSITTRFPLQRISFSSPCSLSYDVRGKVVPQMQRNSTCDPYPLYQLTKWIWAGLNTSAPLAHALLRKVFLSQEQYEDILRKIELPLSSSMSKRSSQYRDIACQWLKRNRGIWQRWLPERPKKVQMLIGGMFPKRGGRWYDTFLIEGARAGVKKANSEILRNNRYEIVMDEHFISCDRQDEALYEYNRIVLDNCGKIRGYLLGVIAASCSDSIGPMISLSQHYRTVIISPTVESRKYSKKEKFKFFFRTVPDMRMYAPYLGGTFKELKWARAALFRKDDHFIKKNQFSHSSIEIVDDFEMGEEQLKFDDVIHSLRKAKDDNEARIFVVEYFEKGTSLILCAAAKLGMKARSQYVWFLNPWLRDNFLRKREIREYYSEKKHGGCTLKEMLEVVEVYFVLTHRLESPTSENVPGSKYYPFVQDAVLVFAQALKNLAGNDTRLLSRLSDKNVSLQWLHTLRTTKFGKGTKTWKFEEGNTPPNRVWRLIQYHCKTSENNCTSNSVGMWIGKSNNSSVEDSRFYTSANNEDLHPFYWIDNIHPGDGSRIEDLCFWPYLARQTGDCKIAILILVLIVLSAIFLIGIMFIIILRPQYKQLKEAKRQLAPFSDILADLAPLEMKPFQIVLNLPLGEGAFGTVRGGEAKLNGQWHAVAVKTLHERATQEEKMEFLSEARIMKAFNHPNIVKLLGVRAQSKSEPYMTVMEFMLYGDMKKYLIARHVLAKEEPNHTDICPSTLTSMTIDIVSGLEYLHNLSYIHRDLALRNCLVGQNRQVKLCDFGLTREVNERRDYYRFERRGMLPVRWMAPESLHSGVFTVKSDIWSFGVVLYEIVTFGNKPYRDKRNEDVIECMRLGNDCLIRYLNNPEDRLPKLLTLMRECFHFHPHERPDAPTILNYLRSDPTCVRPCLEEAPPDPGELPAGLLGPESGDRRRGGSGGGGPGLSSTATDRIRFHSGPRGSTSTAPGAGLASDSVFGFDTIAAPSLAQHAGLNSSFPPAASSGTGLGAVNGGGPLSPAGDDVRNYASSTEFIPMRATRRLSDALGDEHSPDNASPTTGLLETEISIGSEADALAACDYDTAAVTFSPFANGATPHSRTSLGLGSSHGSLHSRLTHAS